MSSKLTRNEITLFTISAILTIDGIAAAAAIGVQSLSWWVLSFVFFAVPYALVSAELGTCRPSRGGIVHWVKLAFGHHWAARTSWLYWVNVALWMPAAFIMLSGFVSQLFWPEMSLGLQIILAVVTVWIAVAVCVVSLDAGKWVPIIGAWCKMIVVLLLGLGGLFLAITESFANPINLTTLMPSWDVGLMFFPVIIFSLMGFDLVCCAGDEMQNPKRDLPISLLIAGLIITFLYLFAVFGILVAMPVEDIGLVSGLLSTFTIMLAPFPGSDILVVLVGCLAIFSFIANLVTWGMGANRAAAEAAADKELPAIFAVTSRRYNTPLGASVLMGVVSSVAILIYGVMASSAEELFWSLFSFSTLIFLLPYLMLFPAYYVLKNRSDHINIESGWQLPDNKVLTAIIVVSPLLITLLAVVIFIAPPESGNWWQSVLMLGGVSVTILIGEMVMPRPVSRSQVELYNERHTKQATNYVN